jgi:hypothetical protein
LSELLGFRPTDIGAAALVGLVVLLILRGQLVPRRQLDDLRTDKDAQIAAEREEKATWREAHLISEEARREAQDQAAEMLEMSRMGISLFNALPRAGEVKDAGVDQASTAPPP